jgi:hypothetical protein
VSLVIVSCLVALGCAAADSTGQRAAGDVTTPTEHLGRPVGVDFELADWTEVSGYYRRLAGQSPRVLVERVGETTEGRDFLLATISSEENLARLDEIRAASARLADPRGMTDAERERTLSEGKAVLFISIAMHSTETAGPQFGMELAYQLATSEEEPYRTARENTVVVMAPCTNPDGLDHVVSWYRETVGTPYESSSMLKLYQYYTGHDNNRDWFMLSQNETRIMTEQLYSVWHPQVYWDVHQQGSSRERFFVPPFRDPLNPNLDASVIAGIDALGSRALLDMTREGLTGISTGVVYDMWWNGGNRNVPVRHNIIGLLTEAASVNVASPVFLPVDRLSGPRGLDGYMPSNRFPAPWPGGWWRLRDIIDYEHGFARSLLGSLGREPRVWLANALEAAERSVQQGTEGAPRAWIIPSDNRDPAAVRRLVDTLLLGGVEVHVARDELSVDGRTWPAGSVVILRSQPYGDHVKDLFEVQRYPDGDPPYDVAGWTLPYLLGVHRVEAMAEPIGDFAQVNSAEEAVASFDAMGADATLSGPVDAADGDAWRAAFRRLASGQSVVFRDNGFEAAELDVATTGADGEVEIARLPRIGLYSPWSGSMDEGWMRWVFDQWDVPFLTVRNEMLRAGRLDELIDVLIIPSVSSWELDRGRTAGTVPEEFARGLDPEGAVAVDAFVRAGGRLITLGSSSRWAVELFELPLTDVARGKDAGEFSCPGSVLRGVPQDSLFTAGLADSTALFFSNSSAWEREKVKKTDEDGGPSQMSVLMRYAPTRVLLSGWIRDAEVIEGRAAWVRAQVGRGGVHLFGFRPQYRSWSQATFPLVFRALLLDDAR